MSTFMNCTYQSFNFLDRQGARPFYDLIANLAAEEFGHIELVAVTINTMLTGASRGKNGKAPTQTLAPVKGLGNPHHFLSGGRAPSLRTRRGARGTVTTCSRRAIWSKT
jgi:manganese catalase